MWIARPAEVNCLRRNTYACWKEGDKKRRDLQNASSSWSIFVEIMIVWSLKSSALCATSKHQFQLTKKSIGVSIQRSILYFALVLRHSIILFLTGFSLETALMLSEKVISWMDNEVLVMGAFTSSRPWRHACQFDLLKRRKKIYPNCMTSERGNQSWF